jgi:hypothetical protein
MKHMQGSTPLAFGLYRYVHDFLLFRLYGGKHKKRYTISGFSLVSLVYRRRPGGLFYPDILAMRGGTPVERRGAELPSALLREGQMR